MNVSYGQTWFLYLIIPSVFSIIACSILIVSVANQPDVRDRSYHRLSFALAVSQVIMFSSWLLGNKYDADEPICKVQDLLFQFGQMMCTSTITFINAYIFYVLRTRQVPSDHKVKYIYITVIALCVISVVVCIAGDTASMFCGPDRTPPTDRGNYDNGTMAQRIKLRVVYLYPLVLMLIVNIIFICYTVWKFVFALRGPDNVLMLPLVRRLMVFSVAVIFCGFPKAISFFFFEDIKLFANIANSFIHISGVVFSSFYFYYAMEKEKRSSHRPGNDQRNPIRDRFGSTASSTPDDAIRDSSFGGGVRIESDETDMTERDSNVAFRLISKDSAASFNLQRISQNT
mmetsp:Transcript_11575/g.18897  ORF Transcript_11575/g.18897 Transcript_11575/m.18897 type:complete len:343 (+) Transcript_11575:135-1163(+)